MGERRGFIPSRAHLSPRLLPLHGKEQAADESAQGRPDDEGWAREKEPGSVPRVDVGGEAGPVAHLLDAPQRQPDPTGSESHDHDLAKHDVSSSAAGDPATGEVGKAPTSGSVRVADTRNGILAGCHWIWRLLELEITVTRRS